MNGVFLDTVGLIAVWDSNDQWHEPADAAFDQLSRDKTPLFSTSYVILESGNAASRRPYRHRVDVLRKYLMEAGALIDPTAEELDAAWEAFDRNEAGRAGIVDQVSFIFMRHLGLRRAFTNDAHFRAAGFETCS